jgi:hypothetical protein
MKTELPNRIPAGNGVKTPAARTTKSIPVDLWGRKKPDITSSLFFTQTTPRLVLGTTEYARKQSKLVSLVRPERLPLPYSYCCVAVFGDDSGVDVCDPDTGRDLLHLDCNYEDFEQTWAGLLPVFSKAYLEGDSDARANT